MQNFTNRGFNAQTPSMPQRIGSTGVQNALPPIMPPTPAPTPMQTLPGAGIKPMPTPGAVPPMMPPNASTAPMQMPPQQMLGNRSPQAMNALQNRANPQALQSIQAAMLRRQPAAPPQMPPMPPMPNLPPRMPPSPFPMPPQMPPQIQPIYPGTANLDNQFPAFTGGIEPWRAQ